jgi:MFS family permease
MFGTTYFFQQVHLAESKNWELRTFVALIPFYTITSLISLFSVGFLIDKYRTTPILPFCLLPGVIGFVLAAGSQSIIGAALAFSLLGILQGMNTAIAGAFWPEYFGTKHLGSIRAVATSAIVFASAIGPLFSGLLLDNQINLNSQFYGMAFFMLLFSGGLIAITLFAKNTVYDDL